MSSKCPNPTGKGGFKKGESGNPGGRASLDDNGRKLRELCQSITVEHGIPFAKKILLSKDEKTTDRLRALEWLSERGFGKSIQPTKELEKKQTYDEFLRSAMA